MDDLVPALLRVTSFLVGATVVLYVLSSAIRTVLVPRDERPLLASLVVVPLHQTFRRWAARTDDERRRESILSRFAPTALLLLPLVWSIGVLVGFTFMYWALGVEGREGVLFSGSSLLTLGFSRPEEMPALFLAFLEAFIGLVLVALLISFLPTIYGHFSARERAVSRLSVRAGSPPDPVEMLVRAHRLDMLDDLTAVWSEWTDWMVDLEESHTSFPFLVWFRSPVAGRSWITAAGAALDMAALSVSCLSLAGQYEAQLFMRSGYLALRRVADYFDIAYDPTPLPTAPISVERGEFDEVFERLARSGLPVKPDREQAWKDFAGWRVNYDAALLGLCGVVEPPRSKWSSDRAVPVKVPLRMVAANRAIARVRSRIGASARTSP